MVKVHGHHHHALASLVVNGNDADNSNGVQLGNGIKGKTTVTLGDHSVTASNWEYVTISVVLFLIIAGGIGFCVWRHNKSKEDHKDES